MIGYLKGKVLDVYDNVVLLSVNDVGYEITCSYTALSRLAESGYGEVFTYLAVKEDGVSLYGFNDVSEKNMFLKLITVSGVGPKMGITVLSQMDVNSLAVSIATSDVKTLSKIKGLGKKTAERMILELREKVSKEASDGAEIFKPKREVNEDAVTALMTLGFKRAETLQAVEYAMDNGAKTIEEIIKKALQSIRR